MSEGLCLLVFFPRILISNGSDYDVFSVCTSFYLLLCKFLPFAAFSREYIFPSSNGLLL